MLRFICVLTLCLLTAAAVTSVGHHESATGGEGAAAGSAGLRVFLDPDTGRIDDNPGRDRFRAFDESTPFARSVAPSELRRFELPGGVVGVELAGTAHHATRLVRQADGSFAVVCSQGDDHGGVR